MTLANEEVVEYIEKLDKEAKALREELLRLCWYMRGSISYEEAFFLSPEEKSIINNIIKENIETTEKTGMLFI